MMPGALSKEMWVRKNFKKILLYIFVGIIFLAPSVKISVQNYSNSQGSGNIFVDWC